MALMIPMRRFLGAAVLAVLALPLLAAPFVAPKTVSLQENRKLAPVPAWPSSLGDAVALPRKVDAYVADHFAFREGLLAASAKLDSLSGGALAPHAGPAESVLAVQGAPGQMFLVEGLLQSTGQAVNPQQAERYADWACGLNQRLSARGVRFFTSIAPSPAEVMPEAAPSFALPARRPTDYDLILAGLRACGSPRSTCVPR